MKLELDVRYHREKKEFETRFDNLASSGKGQNLADAVNALLSVEANRSAIIQHGTNIVGVETQVLRTPAMKSFRLFYQALNTKDINALVLKEKVRIKTVNRVALGLWKRALIYAQSAGKVDEQTAGLNSIEQFQNNKNKVLNVLQFFEAELEHRERIKKRLNSLLPEEDRNNISTIRKILSANKGLLDFCHTKLEGDKLRLILLDQWEVIARYCYAKTKIPLYMTRLGSLDELKGNAPAVLKAIDFYEQDLLRRCSIRP